MSDEQERDADAAVIGLYLQIHDRLRWYHNNGLVPRLDDYENADAHFRSHAHEFAEATRRTIDRLTTERDAARAELAKLRAACKVALRWLDSSGYGEDHDAITAIEAAAAIRAALGSEVGDHGPSPEELYRFQNDDGEAPE